MTKHAESASDSTQLGSYAQEMLTKVQNAPYASRTRIGRELARAAAAKLMTGPEVTAVHAAAINRRQELLGNQQVAWTPSDVLATLPAEQHVPDAHERQLPIGDHDEHWQE